MDSLSDLTAKCIRCGFCLEACPTFVVTGRETESPRGRIYLVRSAEQGEIEWDEDMKAHIDTCLGCRACEPACPSGVEYGKILEQARDVLDDRFPERAKGALLAGMTNPTLFRIQAALSRLYPSDRIPGILSRMLSGQEPEAAPPQAANLAPWPPLEESGLPAVKGEVALLEGCAMRVLYPDVHEATRRLLARIGYRVVESKAGCCGALHAHNGDLDAARKLAAQLIADLPGDVPVIVNSAGCGSAMKEYGDLLDEDGACFAARVFDASEFLWKEGLAKVLETSTGLETKATYHDACHLAHGQGIAKEPRSLLGAIPNLELVPLAESDRCCGSAGIYNLTQPKLARQLLERKYEFIRQTGATIVATGNPGCHAWIGQAAREKGDSIRVEHTLGLLESSFSGLRYD